MAVFERLLFGAYAGSLALVLAIACNAAAESGALRQSTRSGGRELTAEEAKAALVELVRTYLRDPEGASELSRQKLFITGDIVRVGPFTCNLKKRTFTGGDPHLETYSGEFRLVRSKWVAVVLKETVT
jgi:hypothetical protein